MAAEPVIPKSAYVLAADVGNTHITLGVVRGEQVFVTGKAPVGDLQLLGDLLAQYWSEMDKPRRLVASSVNPDALAVLERVAAERIQEPPVVVGRDIPVPIATVLPEPGKVGTDRLCTAAAAYDRLRGACVVADFGTAITIDCIDAKGVFQGGAILPGMRMQAAALHAGTSLLPEVELSEPDWVYGRDTRQAIVGGIVKGARGAMRGIVEGYATELGTWPLVITTGGDAALVGMDEGVVQAIVPELSLLGIALAFYRSLVPPEQQAAAEPEQPTEQEDDDLLKLDDLP